MGLPALSDNRGPVVSPRSIRDEVRAALAASAEDGQHFTGYVNIEVARVLIRRCPALRNAPAAEVARYANEWYSENVRAWRSASDLSTFWVPQHSCTRVERASNDWI